MTTNYPISTPDKPVAVKTNYQHINGYVLFVDSAKRLVGYTQANEKNADKIKIARIWFHTGEEKTDYESGVNLIPPTPEPVMGYAVWKDGELMDAVMTITSEDYAIEHARTIGGEFVSFQIPRPGEKQQRRVTEDEIYVEIVSSLGGYRDAAESIMALLEGEKGE